MPGCLSPAPPAEARDARTAKPRHSPQSFVGSHRMEGPPIPARRPEDRPAEGTASCRETGQAHTCNLDPNGRGFMLLLPVGREETLTIPSKDRHTLAKFMEGPWCGKAGAPWGSPHRSEGTGRRGLSVLGAGRASGSTVTTITAEASGGWLPLSLTLLRSSTNSSTTGQCHPHPDNQEAPALPSPQRPFMKQGVLREPPAPRQPPGHSHPFLTDNRKQPC